LTGTSSDPINPEDEIDHAAEDRRKPGETDPADGCADIALGEQHVQGHAKRERYVDERQTDRAALVEALQHCWIFAVGLGSRVSVGKQQKRHVRG
jgi:hypothetical protein